MELLAELVKQPNTIASLSSAWCQGKSKVVDSVQRGRGHPGVNAQISARKARRCSTALGSGGRHLRPLGISIGSDVAGPRLPVARILVGSTQSEVDATRHLDRIVRHAASHQVARAVISCAAVPDHLINRGGSPTLRPPSRRPRARRDRRLTLSVRSADGYPPWMMPNRLSGWSRPPAAAESSSTWRSGCAPASPGGPSLHRSARRFRRRRLMHSSGPSRCRTDATECGDRLRRRRCSDPSGVRRNSARLS